MQTEQSQPMAGDLAGLNLHPTQVAVLKVVAHFESLDDQVCWASRVTIAERLGITPRHLRRIAAQLVERGFLVHNGQHRKYKTNLWSVNWPAVKRAALACGHDPDVPQKPSTVVATQRATPETHSNQSTESELTPRKTYGMTTKKTREGDSDENWAIVPLFEPPPAPEKHKRRTKQPPPREIRLLRGIALRYPPKDLWPELVTAVQKGAEIFGGLDDPRAVQFLKECRHQWALRYNPVDWSWVTDWFALGHIKHVKGGNNPERLQALKEAQELLGAGF